MALQVLLTTAYENRTTALRKMNDDMEDYGFTYSDEDIDEEEDADVENHYYNSRGVPALFRPRPNVKIVVFCSAVRERKG